MPLIVLTADRPPELREVGRRPGDRPDQALRLGRQVVRGGRQPRAGPRDGASTTARSRAAPTGPRRAGGPGPVHLNFPLREPLAPVAEELDPADWEGRADGRPWTRAARARAARRTPTRSTQLAARIAADAARGDRLRPDAPSGCAEPAARPGRRGCGWPLLAEPTSGVRCGTHDRSHVVAHYDVLLRDERFAAAHRARRSCCASATCRPRSRCAPGSRTRPQVVVDPHAAWHEPTRRAELLLASPRRPRSTRSPSALEMRTREPRSGLARVLARAPTRWCPARSPRRPTPSSRKLLAALEPRAARRRARLGQLVDADPRRRGLLPAVAEADPLPREPRRQRHRRRASRRRSAPRSPRGLPDLAR